MSRRIFDEVTSTALSKAQDRSISAHYQEMYGGSSVVVPLKDVSAKIKRSSLGLYPNTLSRAIKNAAAAITLEEGDCFIKTRRGVLHQVNPQVIKLLKAIFFYHTTCNPEVQQCLSKIMIEIGDFFTFNTTNINIELDENNTKYKNKDSKLMSYCRKEIFSLLTEAGVQICTEVTSD